jgi:hypothetical protein
MTWATICLVIALVLAALMMLKVAESPRFSYWGGVVFFVILSWLVSGAVSLPPIHR